MGICSCFLSFVLIGPAKSDSLGGGAKFPLKINFALATDTIHDHDFSFYANMLIWLKKSFFFLIYVD